MNNENNDENYSRELRKIVFYFFYNIIFLEL